MNWYWRFIAATRRRRQPQRISRWDTRQWLTVDGPVWVGPVWVEEENGHDRLAHVVHAQIGNAGQQQCVLDTEVGPFTRLIFRRYFLGREFSRAVRVTQRSRRTFLPE